MRKQIIALLLICSLAFYANAAADTACHADCGAGAVGTACEDTATGAVGPATHCKTCANTATHKVLMTAAAGTYGTCTAVGTGCSTATDAKVYKSGQTSGSEVLYYCWTPVADSAKLLCATISQTIASYFYASTDAYLKDCATCSTPASNFVEMDSITGTAGYCKANSATCTAPATGKAGAKIFKSGSTTMYTCMTTTLEAGQSKACTSYSNSGADHMFADAATALADCTACAATGESLILTAATDTKGSCVLTTAPCNAATKYIERLAVASTVTSIYAYCDQTGATPKHRCGKCTAKATDGSATACATLAFGADDYSFTADPADRCATCTDSGTKSVLMTAATNSYGTCTLNTATCATFTVSTVTYPSAKVYKVTNPTQTILYYCIAASHETGQSKVCLTYTTAAASFIASITAALTDCTSCAATGESLILTAATDTKGSCVLTTAPCDAATKYIERLAVASTVTSIYTYCDQTGASAKHRCGKCTAKSAASRCTAFAFSNTDYSFASEPTVNCLACTDGTDIMLVSVQATYYYGECLVSTTVMTTKCTSNGYRQYYTHANFAYCGTATDGATKCVKCVAVTDCATIYYPTTPAAKTVYLTTDTVTANTYCLTCQATGSGATAHPATDYFVKVTGTTQVYGACTLLSAPGCAAGEAVLVERTDFGLCTAITLDAAETPQRQICAGWTQTTRFASISAAKDECTSCSGTSNAQVLKESAAAANKGKCYLTASLDTKALCSTTDTVMVYEEDTDATATDNRPSNCQSATYKCSYCATSTKCATFLYAAAVTTGSAEAANGYAFANLAAAELKCLTCVASHYVEILVATNVAGSCITGTDIPCTTATDALIKVQDAVTTGTATHHAAYYFCKRPTAANYMQYCATYTAYTTPFDTEDLAMAGCATCQATHYWVKPNAASGVGSCVTHTEMNGFCTNGKFMKGDATYGICTAVTAATLTGETAATQSKPCAAFDYGTGATKVFFYATNDEALVKCLNCTTTAFSVIGSSSSSIYGNCKDLTQVQNICGDHKYLKQATGEVNYCYDSQDTLLTVAGPPATKYLNCRTFFYDASNIRYANDEAAFQKCLSCAVNKLYVKQASADSYGKCFDNPWSPVPACANNNYVFATGASAYAGVCTAGANGGLTGQMKCKTYFYGENTIFPTTVSTFNDNCYECDAGQVLLRKPGEKRGRCFDTTANAATACGGDGWFLKKGTGDANFGAGIDFSYCEQSDIPTAAYQKQCKTFYYASNTWLDQSTANANNWCRSCGTDQLLLEGTAGVGYGKCINSVTGACASDSYIMWETATAGQLTGICTLVTAANNQVVCDKFYYNNQLYINDNTGNVLSKCISCASTQLLVVTAQSDQYGKCYLNSQASMPQAFTPPVPKFYKKINHLATNLNSLTSATIVQAYSSSACTAFSFANSNAFFKDIFEAEAYCTTCASEFAKIIGVYTTCQKSDKCTAFEGASFNNLFDAELKCTVCKPGYVLIRAATATSGVCTPSEVCKVYKTAFYETLPATTAAECTECKTGYFLVKAAAGDAFGTCTPSTSCLVSSSAQILLAKFEENCDTCNFGYFRIAKAADKANCQAFAASDCLQATDEDHADETAAKAKCLMCKPGFFPLGSGSGVCTAFTKKTDCVKFDIGAATTETLYLNSYCVQCPSEFFYKLNGRCYACPFPCRTCHSTRYIDIDDGNANGFCTSCFEGSGDLVLYTNKMFGICKTCDSSCKTCSGIYMNTAPDAMTRKCESCTYPAYFAYELMTEQGACKACNTFRQPNCLVCSEVGLCIQCQPGYFQTLNETMQCRSCVVADCDVCTDEGLTCLKKSCSSNCMDCSSKTVCTKCNSGYYLSADACTQCDNSCSECSGAGATACTIKKPNYQGSCATNCQECSPADAVVASCTTPFWGYFKFSVTNTADPPVTTVTIEACVPGCKTCTTHAFSSCTECLSGYYKSDAGFVCDRCHSSCEKCDGPSLKECNYCQSGYYLQVVSQGQMDGFCNICNPTLCKTCGGRAPGPCMACTSCYGSKVIDLFFEGFGIKNGPCVDACPEGKFNDGGFCRHCKLGSPSPCPQPPAVSASYLTFPLILIALIIMML